jgi:hypothetical protein
MTQRKNYYSGYLLKIDGNLAELSLRKGNSPPFTIEEVLKDEEIEKLGNDLDKKRKIVLGSYYNLIRIE